MKKVLMLALTVITAVLIVMFVPVARASLDQNSTADSVGTSVSVTPVSEEVSYTITTVNPSTSKVEPIRVAATPVDSCTPIFLWIYVMAGVGLAAITMLGFSLKRRRHRLSPLRLLSSLSFVALLMTPLSQVHGEETFNVSVWNLQGTGIGLPMIVRESVDSAGNVWFGNIGRARIGCLNPFTNEVKVWVVPETGDVQSVSVDSADHVWFTGIDRIGLFDPSTNFFTVWSVAGISYWAGGHPYTFPLISTDSWGNAFFPTLATNKICRINPVTNELTEWVIPTNESQPCYTMVDANDNVWFAERAGNKIGRLNPYTNEITEWTIPTPEAYPSGLYVTGGLVYFAEYAARKIGCLDPNTNQVTQWSLSGVPGVEIYGMFVDPGGNAWSTSQYVNPYFQQYSTLYIYRLNVNNIFTYWTLQPASTSFGVTVDTKINVGDVYVSAYYNGSYAILRFRPAL